MARYRNRTSFLVAAGIAILLAVARQQGWLDETSFGDTSFEQSRTARETPVQQPASDSRRPSRASEEAEGTIDRLFAEGRSDAIVAGEGVIQRVLSDDNEGSRHQRLIVELPSGLTVLIAHNIDLAPRIPDPRRGERIAFRGEYEWNDRGGVIHWTHHDPRGSHPGGWLDYRGRRFE